MLFDYLMIVVQWDLCCLQFHEYKFGGHESDEKLFYLQHCGDVEVLIFLTGQYFSQNATLALTSSLVKEGDAAAL